MEPRRGLHDDIGVSKRVVHGYAEGIAGCRRVPEARSTATSVAGRSATTRLMGSGGLRLSERTNC